VDEHRGIALTDNDSVEHAAISLARELADHHSLVFSSTLASLAHWLFDNSRAARQSAEEVIRVSDEQGFA
jgi:hypothetical protein